jgi:hypothetical protein
MNKIKNSISSPILQNINNGFSFENQSQFKLGSFSLDQEVLNGKVSTQTTLEVTLHIRLKPGKLH